MEGSSHQVPQLWRPHVFPPANPQLRLRLLRGEHALGRGRTGASPRHGHTPYAASGGRRPAELTHVSQLEPAQDSDWYYYKPYWRNMSLLERLLWEDPQPPTSSKTPNT